MLETGVILRHKPDFIQRHNERRMDRPVEEDQTTATSRGRVPRVARLMALAIRFEHLLGSGAVQDQAELAELGHVTRARVTQIMNLLHLAPDIQEAILSLPLVVAGRAPIQERYIRPIAAETDWNRQRRLWREILQRGGLTRVIHV